MGIKTVNNIHVFHACNGSEKPPHHMGIKTVKDGLNIGDRPTSEKPPHHMGIKTRALRVLLYGAGTLKNLPTTWGLRQLGITYRHTQFPSEKPPHHMGIKTSACGLNPPA